MKTVIVKQNDNDLNGNINYSPICDTAFILSRLRSGSNMTASFTSHDIRTIKKLGYKVIIENKKINTHETN